MKRNVIFTLAAAAVALTMPQVARSNGPYTFTDLSLSKTNYNVGPVAGLNDSLTFIAVGTPVSTVPGPLLGLVFTPSATEYFTVPGATAIYTSHISKNGSITGYYSNGNPGLHGFVVYNMIVNRFNVPNAAATLPYAVADNGDILGAYQLGPGMHAFLYRAGNYTTYDYPGADRTFFIDEAITGEILGRTITGGVSGAFLIQLGDVAPTPITIAGASQVYPTGINNSEVIAGYYQETGKADLHGFVRDNAVNTVVDYPWSPTIVQNFGTGNETLNLWHTFTLITGINNNGVLCGYGSASYTNGNHQVILRNTFKATPTHP